MSSRFAISAIARIAGAAIAVAVIAQLLVAASPGTPGERAARAAGVLPPDDSQIDRGAREQLVAEVAARHRLDRPLAIRIATSVARMLAGDLGRSWRDERPVASIAGRSAGRTLPLIAVALLLSIAIGFAVAGFAVRRRGGPAVAVADAAISAALVTPPVWLALLLLAIGGGAPAYLVVELGCAVVALAVLPAAVIGRHARAVLERSMSEPWATAARARGLSDDRLIRRYGRRELGAELGPLLAPLVGYLLGAALVIETVFGIRGLGATLADAASRGDAPVVVGLSVVCALAVAIAGVAGQLLSRRCDPRLREVGA